MLRGLVRLAACAASGAAFLALTGCGGGQPEDSYTGAPPAAYDRGDGGTELMGGQRPPARADDGSGLLGGPDGYGRMAPIPNPADLTRAERVRYYGHKYDHLPEPRGAKATGGRSSQALLTRRRQDGTLEVSMRPIANPEDMSAAERRRIYGNRYAPAPRVPHSPRRRSEDAPRVAAAPVAKPVVQPAARPAPAKPAPVAKPVVAAAPVVAPPVLKPAPTLKQTPAEQLSAAVKPEAMRGAVLTVPEGLAKGEESKVSLALPANLFDTIKREAAKLGLGKAAKKQEVSATLTGEGYEITPNGPQTQALKPGQAATFDWNVKPGADDKAPLKATVDGTLAGDRKAKTTFSLATLEQAVAAPVAAVKEKASGFKLPSLSLKSLAIPGMQPVDVPGVGKVGSEKLVGAGLALLALLLVLLMARNASANRARAERRRKFRTMQDNMDAEPVSYAPAQESVSQPYVNPMVAAAGGAAAGAAAVHVAHEAHDAHPPHHDAHVEAHAPAVEPGHADHTPAAHDDHAHHEPQAAEAHPVAHHPEPAHHEEHAPATDHTHDAPAHVEASHGVEDHAPAADNGHAHDTHHRQPEPA